jgi:uncharacterized protein DUF4411
MAVVSPTPSAVVYLFDTNAFVDLGERFHPNDVFVGLWANVLSMLNTGNVITCKAVLGELAKAPVIDPWRKTVQAACKPTALDEAEVDIQGEFKKLAAAAIPNRLSDVDRWVLSAGAARNLPIVTRDGPVLRVCKDGRVAARSLTPVEFFREVGWTFP